MELVRRTAYFDRTRNGGTSRVDLQPAKDMGFAAEKSGSKKTVKSDSVYSRMSAARAVDQPVVFSSREAWGVF
jgi:hypothetical protein